MNNEPRFCVIVPFLDEERNVATVCDGVPEKEHPGSEVSVIDGGSGDETGAKLDRIALNLGSRTRAV